MFTDLMQLHKAGKIHNLHQVCGVFGCVGQRTEKQTVRQTDRQTNRHSYLYISVAVPERCNTRPDILSRLHNVPQ